MTHVPTSDIDNEHEEVSLEDHFYFLGGLLEKVVFKLDMARCGWDIVQPWEDKDCIHELVVEVLAKPDKHSDFLMGAMGTSESVLEEVVT